MDKSHYKEKLLELVSDSNKFQPVRIPAGKSQFNIIINQEDNLRRLLLSLKNSNKITPESYQKMQPSGSKPGIFYGLPKIHKQGVPLRPITSAIGTPPYNTAKELTDLLKPITVNKFCVKDSFSFAQEISALGLGKHFMASLDVQSLFTNIPLNETINICALNVLRQNPSLRITQSELEKLLHVCTSDNVFLCDGQLYRQIDGVAMGSPLGPSLSCAFLAHHETVWLADCPTQFKPIMYRRYVDDIFVLFESPDHLPLFVDYMNSRHCNMKFTSESETNNSFNFLDVNITRSGDKFETSLYRKPTFSGVYCNYESYLPSEYKVGLVSTLLFRIYHICSSMKNVHCEIENLKSILSKNLYPKSIVDQCISKFFNRVYEPKDKPQNVPKKPVFLVLPYLGVKSVLLKRRVEILFRTCLPQVKCNIIFKAPKKLSQFFPFKDRVPECLLSRVVYKFTCNGCNSVYYGKTNRHLRTRASEHLGISARTGKAVKNKMQSAISDHLSDENHNASFDDFTVLASAPSDYHLLILESLLISKDRPNLNNNIASVPLKLF